MESDSLPGVLYKYLPSQRVDVISSSSVRFSQFSALNDPYECSACFDTGAYLYNGRLDRILAESLEGKQRTPEHVDALRRHFAPGSPRVEGIINGGMSKIRDLLRAKVGVLSLSKSCVSAPMWAHYGEGHRGFCLGLDVSLPPVKCVGETSIWPVEYGDVPPVVNPDVTQGPRAWAAFVATKSSWWKYEQEVRIVRSIKTCRDTGANDAAGHRVYVSSFPPRALKQVIFGAQASPFTRDSVRQACKGIGALPVFLEAIIKTGSYELGMVPAD